MSAAARRASHGVLDEPHHDGSELHVLERPDELGGDAVVRLRVPRATSADRVLLRYERDGEPRGVEAIDRRGDRHRRLVARRVPGREPGHALPLAALGRRRRLRVGERPRHARAHEVADADDFVITAGTWGPDWHLESVVYQIFPDRFADVRARDRRPDWAMPRGWDELPTGRGRPTPFELLRRRPARRRAAPRPHRVARREPHLPDAVLPGQLDPPLRRDDASQHVDPLLGGDDALALARARGPRARDPAARRHHAEPHGPRARVVPERAQRRPVGARARVLLLRRRRFPAATSRGSATARCRSSTGGATELHERFAERPPPLPRARARRLAHRRREHGRALPRRST